jgi:serine/threonine protein kinase/Tol biopolymer transport system component
MPGGESNDNRTHSFVALSEGTTVSHYRIIQKIGAGGMGEVYLAEDTQLDRRVALKFLPPHLCQDEAARARFTREAKAAAKLNHPNIVQVFEVGDFQGRPFFAMAHVEGKSLREVIKEGKLSINEAIEFTKQICEGLHKAHQSGVVHRDIKPGNIIIDHENKPRILDFGLATVAGEDKLTRTGSTLGTVGYMSPEQIEGKRVDHRSDLFSVGVILYEMLTGRRPFEGDTDVAIARSITDKVPEPVTRYKSGTTGELQLAIDRALAKDPQLRYQHADEVISELKRIESGYPSVKKRHRWGLGAMVALVIVALFVIFLFGDWNKSERPYRIISRQITFDGDVYRSELSPDGNYIAYVRGEYHDVKKADSMRVFVKDLTGGSVIQVMTDNAIAQIRWTPDGEKLLIRADNDTVGGFYLIPRLGGPAQLFKLFRQDDWWNMSWAPDGKQFATHCSQRKTLWIVDVESGRIDTLIIDRDIDWIYNVSWSPVADILLVETIKGSDFQLWTMSIDGKELTEIPYNGGRNPRWSANGNSIIYQWIEGSTISVLEHKYSSDKHELLGQPVIVFSGFEGEGWEEVDITKDHDKASYTKRVKWENLWLTALNLNENRPGKNNTALTSGTARIRGIAFSPIGNQVAYSKLTNGTWQIFVQDLGTNERHQLTHTGSFNFGPAWSLDGKQLAFGAYTDNSAKLAVVAVTGGVPRIFESCIVETGYSELKPILWTSSNEILYRVSGHRGYIAFDLDLGIRRALASMSGWDVCFSPVLSPDRSTIAAVVQQIDTVRNLDSTVQLPSGVWLLSTTDSTSVPFQTGMRNVTLLPVGWSKNADSLFLWQVLEKQLLRVSLEDHGTDTLVYQPGIDLDVALSLDNTKIAYTMREQTSDVWLVERIYADRP